MEYGQENWECDFGSNGFTVYCTEEIGGREENKAGRKGGGCIFGFVMF